MGGAGRTRPASTEHGSSQGSASGGLALTSSPIALGVPPRLRPASRTLGHTILMGWHPRLGRRRRRRGRSGACHPSADRTAARGGATAARNAALRDLTLSATGLAGLLVLCLRRSSQLLSSWLRPVRRPEHHQWRARLLRQDSAVEPAANGPHQPPWHRTIGAAQVRQGLPDPATGLGLTRLSGGSRGFARPRGESAIRQRSAAGNSRQADSPREEPRGSSRRRSHMRGRRRAR